MAQDVNVNVNFNTKKAESNVKQLTAEEKKLVAETKKLAQAQKDQEKQQQDLINNMGVFGMTIGGLKSNIKGLKVATGLFFKTLTRGLLSTGIGALLLAFGSLVTFLTKSQDGAEKLEIAFAKFSAGVKVIVDRITSFGRGLTKLFRRGGFKEGIDDMKNSFKGVGEEIKNDVELTDELTKRAIDLRKARRELNKETANQRAEVERLKLIAEDQSKSTDERLVAAQKAFNIEQNILDKRVANAQEEVRLQKEQMALGENLEKDQERLTELEIQLANVKQESLTKQIELNNKVNSIKKEGEAQTKAEADKEQMLQDKKLADLEVLRLAQLNEDELEVERVRLKYQKLIDLANKYGLDTTELTKKMNEEIAGLDEENTKQRIKFADLEAQQKVAVIGGAMGDLAKIFGEESKAGKTMAIGQALIDTYAGVNKALAQGGIFGAISGAGILASGLRNVAKIKSTSVDRKGGSNSGGGGSVPSTTRDQSSESFSLTPNQLLSVTPNQNGMQPVQAFVVESDISNSQALQEELEIQSTL
tara:strand:- start:1689 stop:3287 length:1599 start_codon:yes stop_codon:yes gene_type:complete